jgi:hypothetical protein
MVNPQVDAAIITSIFILVGFGVNAWLNRKHRNIVVVTNLVKDFYHDIAYVELRIKSYCLIAKMSDEDCNWRKVMARIASGQTAEPDAQVLVAVNRTAAFYLAVRGLIQQREVNVEMLRSLFGYNYTVYWNCVREKIWSASNKQQDKELFAEIPELLIRGAERCDLKTVCKDPAVSLPEHGAQPGIAQQ